MATTPEKEPAKTKQTSKNSQMDLTVRSPIPGNRPIVATNRDADIDDFVGYMD